MTSQLTNNIKRLPLITSNTMEKVNNAVTAKNRLYRGSPIMYREEYTCTTLLTPVTKSKSRTVS